MLVKNNYYSCIYSGSKYVILYEDDIKCPYCVKNSFSYSGWKFWESSKDIQPATNEEIAWLNACIKAQKYIKRELIKYEEIYECW